MNITKALNRLSRNLTHWGALVVLLTSTPAYAEEVTYYHHDALGSIVAATDENGALLWKEAYRPYGEQIRKENNDTNTIWYTGKPHEEEMGLSYFGARWYDPNTGRFMAIDPVGVDEGNIHSFNRYAYANNNPYKFVDPDGRNAALAGCALGPGGCIIGVGLTILAVQQGIQGTQDALNNENSSANEPPAPALDGNPWNPQEVDKRRSETRRQEGAPSNDPDSPIPERGPGSDQGGHDSRGKTPHDTGERNVNRHEEHSRRPKANPSGSNN